jgi:hypothetical protein
MATSFVSPGVFINEKDASFLGPGVGAIGAAILGRAPMGPAFVPVTVKTFSDFASFFGDLDSDYLLGYAARAYLKNAGSANIVRVLGPTGRTVNGTAVTPGYTSEGVWGILAGTGSTEAVLALLEITGTTSLKISSISNDLFLVSGSGGTTFGAGLTASFLTSSANYIKKVLNTDPTLFSTYGYYVREVYDYATKLFINGAANFNSASYGITNFQFGYNSGSSPWITSQGFGGTTVNLFRVHTLGHGEAENGRFKISITNIRPSAAPTVTDYGKFDLEVRDFADTDRSKSVVETYPNLSLDPTDSNYILRVIGDRLIKFDVSRNKMVEFGDFPNASRLIRVELTTGSIPAASLPWGFRGLDKPALASTGSTTSAIRALPLVANLFDKETQSEARNNVYWGMETQLSGNVRARLDKLPTMTDADSDFSLKFVSGSSLSNLVYNASNPAASQKVPGTTTADTTLESSLAKFTVPVAFGYDGFDRRIADPLNNESQLASVSQLGTQALRQAVDIVADPDFIDINILAIPGVYSSKVTDYAILATEARSDAFYISDITGSTPTAVIQEVNGRGFNTNYAGVYYPSIKVYDDVNKVSKVLPASIAALGAIAFNDRVGYAWLAPAGLNRAGLSRDTIGFDVLGLQDQLTQAERDALYEARINPIARFPDVPQGVIWGQKTLQLRPSALDRINVRRLLIAAKKLVASAVKFLVFEPGDPTTMTRFKQLVNPLLADIQQKRGLEKFLVVMDSSINTPDVIDRNQLKGQIFLVPSKATEFISIDFVISPSGAVFNE